jgi:hypothetical protein
MHTRRFALAAPLLLAACTTRAPAPTFIVPGADGADVVARTLAAAPLGAAENFRAQPVVSGQHASIAVVQIRDREEPHIHTRYDLTVAHPSGEGTRYLVARQASRGRCRPAMACSFPGHAHWFVNDATSRRSPW